MRRNASCLIFIIPLLLVSCKKPETHQVREYTIEQFMNTVSISGSSFSHDEKNILFSSNQTGIYNAYTLPVQGGKAIPLTDSKEDAIFAISYFPDDDRILYRSDKGGNEITHIYLRNEDGTAKDLTPDEKAKANFYGWSFDEKSFYFGSNKRDARFMDLYEMDIKTFTPKMIYRNDQGYELGAISRDKRYFALIRPITTSNSDMYLYDTHTKK
jgi:WD40 repeat protein